MLYAACLPPSPQIVHQLRPPHPYQNGHMTEQRVSSGRDGRREAALVQAADLIHIDGQLHGAALQRQLPVPLCRQHLRVDALIIGRVHQIDDSTGRPGGVMASRTAGEKRVCRLQPR